MKHKKFSYLFSILIFFLIVGNGWSEELKSTDPGMLDSSIMRPDRESRRKWMDDYEKAPLAPIHENIRSRLLLSQEENVGTSLSLLDYLQYTPNERNQGGCGNCWVWAGTGLMEIAYGVQSGVNDRFSVQFFNSCKTDSYACCGGNLSIFANWYRNEGFAIPWSNTNAAYSDGSRSCSNNSSSVSCGSISTDPNYPFSSIQAQTISTTGVTQATAIANIKNVLNQNKAVWFGYWLANQTDWNAFYNFWNNQVETTLWTPDAYCGHTWNDYSGGGHAVVIVGYNDDDPTPANNYWIVLNSWGTAGGRRPNGLFRMPMQMNYQCTISEPGYGNWYSRQFQTLNITYTEDSCTYSIDPQSQSYESGGGSGNVNVVADSGCGWTAVSNATWLTITSGSSGSGNGTVFYSVAANINKKSRTGTMTIAGRTFTVTQSGTIPLTIVSPNGGEQWQAGTAHTITWNYIGDPGPSVKIKLLKNGVTVRTIAKNVPSGTGGTGSYLWNIPSSQTPGNDYKIKVFSPTNKAYSDKSNGNFTIY
jgi:hypothetical protein